MARAFPVVDCDGHIIEAGDELIEFLDDRFRHPQSTGRLTGASRFFPGLDGMHMPQARRAGAADRPRVDASDHRTGSAEDWVAFLERAEIERSVMFTTAGLSVGIIQNPDYANAICRAYNDYVSNNYRKVSDRLHPMALIPMQSVDAAVKELRRAVVDLGLPGAMLPTRGLPVNLGHELYWPIYEEAERLDCVLALHGGSNSGLGMEGFTDNGASHILHHPLPLIINFVSYFRQGVAERYPNLRIGFMEGGTAWIPLMLDRMDREVEYGGLALKRSPEEYLRDGRLFVTCEGNERSLSYVIERVGPEPFMFASDFPHEISMDNAMEEIDEILNRDDLQEEHKQMILGENARRFYGK